jgi:hypothetical protein
MRGILSSKEKQSIMNCLLFKKANNNEEGVASPPNNV